MYTFNIYYRCQHSTKKKWLRRKVKEKLTLRRFKVILIWQFWAMILNSFLMHFYGLYMKMNFKCSIRLHCVESKLNWTKMHESISSLKIIMISQDSAEINVHCLYCQMRVHTKFRWIINFSAIFSLHFAPWLLLNYIFFCNDVNDIMFDVAASQKQLKICIIFWYITFTREHRYTMSSRREKHTHTYIVYNWWMHICLCPSNTQTHSISCETYASKWTGELTRISWNCQEIR